MKMKKTILAIILTAILGILIGLGFYYAVESAKVETIID